MSRLRLGAAFVAVAVASSMLLAPAQAATAQTSATSFRDVLVKGTGDNGERFRGRLDIVKFVSTNEGVKAVGNLDGRVRDADGNLIGRVEDKRIRVPLAAANGTCEILHLELGPLDLDLLGLVIHLDRIELDITAEQGPGNLLGNLLCAIAGLLDPGVDLPDILAQLLTLLTRLLDLFS
ncbi:MAG TPA: hypothetical protein VHJ34_11360 [Actinomycetota bacterium]|nr:hypothetical protein [Actinomycetota bacterium]